MTVLIGEALKRSSRRIAALDGLRGLAALAVVVFHFLCFVFPTFVPTMASTSKAVTQTPFYVLWNGGFAVVIFFVLSGFVIAAAADRRSREVLVNSTTRYVRLALPVTVSCLLAWLWIAAFPNAAQTMAVGLDDPSRWLEYTYQGSMKPVSDPLADGLVLTFQRGYSDYNNVLWTMQIELVGSLGLFVLYWLLAARIRVAALILTGLAVVITLPNSYLTFVLGAGLYEAHRRGALRRLPAVLPPVALLLAVLLGGPGAGAHGTWGLPDVPDPWQLGNDRGVLPIIAAGLLIYAALMLPVLAGFLAMRGPLWLGRVSFGLYLVHVPPLYTVVAWAYVTGALPLPLLAAMYFAGVLTMAWVFTLCIDEPVLRCLSLLRLTRAKRLRQRSPEGDAT